MLICWLYGNTALCWDNPGHAAICLVCYMLFVCLSVFSQLINAKNCIWLNGKLKMKLYILETFIYVKSVLAIYFGTYWHAFSMHYLFVYLWKLWLMSQKVFDLLYFMTSINIVLLKSYSLHASFLLHFYGMPWWHGKRKIENKNEN